MFDTTVIKKTLDGLKRAVESGRFADALVSAINTGNGLMQQRIFTRGQDTRGQSFGQYTGRKTSIGIESQRKLIEAANTRVKKNRAGRATDRLTPYERKRVLSGRQVSYKDLEFTGGLRRSIQIFIENERTVSLAFNNDEYVKIARGQEAQIENLRQGRKGTTRNPNPTPIFTFSDDETNQVVDQGVELIVDQILK